SFYFFFVQAEDGIRDRNVTGVQTCALPIFDHGFRLPSALDNRPLRFEEFEDKTSQLIYISATPGPYEMEHAPDVTEQIIRPTGLLDPKIDVRPIKGHIDDLIGEVNKRNERNERVLIRTSNKKVYEDIRD